MRKDNSIRKFFLKKLSVEQYMLWARRYNDLLSPFRERHMQRPIDGHVIDCDLPLIYISQSPRCGGTLTRNLLDGHPQLHVYPSELSWQKNGFDWGEGLLNDQRTLLSLRDGWLTNAIRYGVDRRIPFYFNRRIQKKLFVGSSAKGTRAVLGRYLTSFFNAWTNYQGLYGTKKYCAAFCPWNSADKESVNRFFQIYPDGFRIHIIRNPHAWWASEKSYTEEGKSLDHYLNQNWLSSVSDAIDRHKERPERYLLLSYDQLCLSPESTMRELCKRLELVMDPILLSPTVNRMPRRANTSHDDGKAKGAISISSASLRNWEKVLTQDEVAKITDRTATLYQSALDLCLNPIASE